MTRIIGIVSGKGGVGKTTIATNLGVALSQKFNKQVAIIDANVTTAHLGLQLGIVSTPFTINDVLLKKTKIDSAKFNYLPGLDVVTASINLEDLKRVNILDLKKYLRDSFKDKDFVIIDSAPGFGREAVATLQASDELLFVTNPYIPAVVDIGKAIHLVKGELEAKSLGIILNRVEDKKYELSTTEIEAFCSLPVIAKIPEDENVLSSINSRAPVITHSPSSKVSTAIIELASRITGEPYSWPKKSPFRTIVEFFIRKKGV